MQRHDTEPQTPAARRPFPVPWGLIITLNLYATLVIIYIWLTFWRSPEYQAAKHFEAAQAILGLDDGRKVSRAELDEAYREMLEAARLMPRVKMLHERTERLRWRYDERKFKLDPELANRAEALSMIWRRAEDEATPFLVVGARDRGWTPEQLLAGPMTIALWSLPGGVVILVIWAYLRFSAKRVRANEHEEEIQRVEEEIAQSERMKRRAINVPAKTRPRK